MFSVVHYIYIKNIIAYEKDFSHGCLYDPFCFH
jgi:hypothetical protein